MSGGKRGHLGRLLGAGLLILATAWGTAGAVAGERPAALPRLNIDAAQTTVSGISSGAYMAGQVQIAYSSLVRGAGLVAGGPYSCATATEAFGIPAWVVALERCMDVKPAPPDLGLLVRTARAAERSGDIDPLSNLAGARIYLFSGARDKTVKRPVVDRAADLYKALGVPPPAIAYVKDPRAAHAFITDGYGAACGFSPPPGEAGEFMNDCGYDQAGAILKHLLPGLRTPNAREASRPVQTFDQTPFIGDPSRSGMAASGYVYIPDSCAAGRPCRLHIAFHGCRMAGSLIGDRFAVHAGFNRWADVNDLVVLYPQIDSQAKPLDNPRGCWDWFAYTGPDFAQKGGFQMKAVRRMIAAVAG